MAETQTGTAATPEAADQEKGRIPAALLKLVQRPVTNKDGKPVMDKGEPKLRQVKADEVLDWREYSDRVVVVTIDGQKYVGAKETK